MLKTLGGDRLGAGKKMKVELHNYERSTHDLGYIWRSTISAGTLVPFMTQVALPGDTFDITLDAFVNTHPTIGPLFGSFKMQLDIFQCPIRLYQGQLHNNKLGIGMEMSKVKLPMLKYTVPYEEANVIQIHPDYNNSQVNPSCLLSYLGIRGIGVNMTQPEGAARYFNAIPLLSYWDIYKNYYANKQEEIGAAVDFQINTIQMNVFSIVGNNGTIPQAGVASEVVPLDVNSWIELTRLTGLQQDPMQIRINTNVGPLTLGTIGRAEYIDANTTRFIYDAARYGNRNAISWEYQLPSAQVAGIRTTTFQLSDIDTMRERIFAATPNNTPFDVYGQDLMPYKLLYNDAQMKLPSSQQGLGLKTYQSDLFNNWLSTEWIDGTNGINAITAIDTSSGSFNIDTLNLSKKVYDMLNRIAVSGGSYDDWLDAVYTHERYQKAETPMYMGGLIKEVIFQEVINNSETQGDGNTQVLGTLAGKGKLSDKHKGGKVVIKVDEPSYLIGIVSLTPRIDYSQGNNWDIHLQTMDDLHKPALDQIGFQELITEQMAWWNTHYDLGSGTWITRSAGKQPAWLNYMTNVNKTYGNFAIENNEMFMTLNRRYEMVLEDPEVSIDDLTTYIHPEKYNNIFAQTEIDAQNFWVQIGVDIEARRKLSAKVMPNL